MKNILTFLLILAFNLVTATNALVKADDLIVKGPDVDGGEVSTLIDANDTIVFDLSNTLINGVYTQFPVYIKSDEIINAVDFSFKYNQVNFLYDSVLDHTAYMQSLAYYNAVDSTVRYTSYSLQPIPNNVSLISVRFLILAGTFCTSDLNTITGYLNGDVCTVQIINCSSTGIADLTEDVNVDVFPNPATDMLSVESKEKTNVQLINMEGREVRTSKTEGTSHKLNVSGLANGLYLLKLYNNKSVSVKKVLIHN